MKRDIYLVLPKKDPVVPSGLLYTYERMDLFIHSKDF